MGSHRKGEPIGTIRPWGVVPLFWSGSFGSDGRDGNDQSKMDQQPTAEVKKRKRKADSSPERKCVRDDLRQYLRRNIYHGSISAQNHDLCGPWVQEILRNLPPMTPSLFEYSLAASFQCAMEWHSNSKNPSEGVVSIQSKVENQSVRIPVRTIQEFIQQAENTRADHGDCNVEDYREDKTILSHLIHSIPLGDLSPGRHGSDRQARRNRRQQLHDTFDLLQSKMEKGAHDENDQSTGLERHIGAANDSNLSWNMWIRLVRAISWRLIVVYHDHPLQQYARGVVPFCDDTDYLLKLEQTLPELQSDNTQPINVSESKRSPAGAVLRIIKYIQDNFPPLPFAVILWDDSFTPRPDHGLGEADENQSMECSTASRCAGGQGIRGNQQTDGNYSTGQLTARETISTCVSPSKFQYSCIPNAQIELRQVPCPAKEAMVERATRSRKHAEERGPSPAPLVVLLVACQDACTFSVSISMVDSGVEASDERVEATSNLKHQFALDYRLNEMNFDRRNSWIQYRTGSACSCLRCQYEMNSTNARKFLKQDEIRILGHYYLGLGRLAAAKCVYHHGLRSAAVSLNDPEVWHAIGAVELSLGHFVRAQRFWREALKRATDYNLPGFAEHQGLALQWTKLKSYGYGDPQVTCGNTRVNDKTKGTLSDSLISGVYSRKGLVDLGTCRKIVGWANSGVWSRDRHYAVPTHDVPVHSVEPLLQWFNQDLMDQLVRPLLSDWFHLPEHEFYVHDAFCVRYDGVDHEAGAALLPIHCDESTHSFVLSLNEDYTGGGTYFYDHDRIVRTGVGDLLCFQGDRILHGGELVVAGARYILAGFLYHDSDRFTEENDNEQNGDCDTHKQATLPNGEPVEKGHFEFNFALRTS
jgi:tetratricopeptide (TPR) repeat protein